MRVSVIHWGEKLREAVESAGIPKKEISDKLGITPGALSSTFASPTLKIDTVFKICEAIGVKAYQFIAYVETGIDVIAWRNFDLIMCLPVPDRTYVLKGISRDIDYILERREKTVDGEVK